ncbi:MAG: lipid-A-disaccharide synthase [Parachlamydiales bacterium]|nr:lipid-A-disaccharide synthase [Verrucomicrobiota bacterium]
MNLRSEEQVKQPWLRTGPDRRSPSPRGKGEDEDRLGCGNTRRFGEPSQCVTGEASLGANRAASPHSEKLTECGLFIFVGEKSADLHGEKILEALKQLSPTLRIFGVGGPKMRAAGLNCVLPMEEFQVMGFVDVFLALPKLMRQFYFVSDQILTLKPKAVLFIDYPGFNLRMAKHLRKKGFQGKLCHYICPSVWAWGKKRIPLMAKHLDLLLTILPFEKSYFADTGLRVEYVGHPLVQRIKDHTYLPFPFPQDKKILAIFPGSRRKELERNLALQLQVCSRLKYDNPELAFALSVSDEKYRPLIEEIVEKQGWKDKLQLVPQDRTYELMRAAHAAIAKSGTVTLELALHGVPTVVTYAISALDLFIARDVLKIRLPFYCLVNIIANSEVFPELFGPNFTEKNLYQKISALIEGTERRICKASCQALKDQLGDGNASQEAAKYVLQLFS